MNHVGKMAFDWVYWNMLLPGHLPQVPLLPSHMNFLGKDLATAPQMRHARTLKVADVMTRGPFTAPLGSALGAVAEAMAKRRISGVPIVDADARLVGILTEADFLSAMNLEGGGLSDLLETVVRKRRARKGMGTIVDDIMTRSPITIAPEATLAQAVQTMDRNKVKRLVVTDENARVQGVVSRGDLMKLFTMK
jgi:sulfide:quinone oxidoreductase